jgi:hypothetical protein
MRTLCEAVHNHVRCGGWIYRCKDCGSTGCSNNSCHVKSFKDRKCLSCGSRSTETVGDYERRMRNEKESEKKRSNNEKSSKNSAIGFGAGVATGSFISKRNQKKNKGGKDMSKQIDIDKVRDKIGFIDENGNVKSEAHGFTGGSCESALNKILLNVGDTVKTELKPEYYVPETVTNQNFQHH